MTVRPPRHRSSPRRPRLSPRSPRSSLPSPQFPRMPPLARNRPPTTKELLDDFSESLSWQPLLLQERVEKIGTDINKMDVIHERLADRLKQLEIRNGLFRAELDSLCAPPKISFRTKELELNHNST